MSRVLDGCWGRSSWLSQRTPITEQVRDQRLVRMTDHIDHEVMIEHHSRLRVLCHVAECARVVRIGVNALPNLHRAQKLASV